MKKIICLIAIPAFALSVGCTNMSTTEQSTLSGAAIGAVGGAAIGGLTGGDAGVGALIGGAAGAGGGNIHGRNEEKKAVPATAQPLLKKTPSLPQTSPITPLAASLRGFRAFRWGHE